MTQSALPTKKIKPGPSPTHSQWVMEQTGAPPCMAGISKGKVWEKKKTTYKGEEHADSGSSISELILGRKYSVCSGRGEGSNHPFCNPGHKGDSQIQRDNKA